MDKQRNPTERAARKRSGPSPQTRVRDTEHDRTLPGRHSPANEKQRARIVNEDEQLKVVNNREDNAQSSSPPADSADQQGTASHESDNERIEAGYDNSEVNPRPPKVN
jgi:hypothetical protein